MNIETPTKTVTAVDDIAGRVELREWKDGTRSTLIMQDGDLIVLTDDRQRAWLIAALAEQMRGGK